MTLNDLKKLIPEEHHDKLIVIYIPQLRAGDEGDYPLIEANINNDKSYVRVYLEADTN